MRPERSGLLPGGPIGMPFVSWTTDGGTSTNFPQIRKRVERLEMPSPRSTRKGTLKIYKREIYSYRPEIDTQPIFSNVSQ